MARTGRCLCGDITYAFDGEPIATAVCHCEHCQRQSGGAFSVNVVMQKDQLSIDGPIATYEDRGRSGDAVYVYRRFCGSCGSPIVSELVEPAGVVALKAGTLDDRSVVAPQAQIWCDDKQPWVELPGLMAMDRE